MKMKFFEKAKAASEMSDYKRIKIGAVIVYKNRVVSVGWNTTKTNPLQKSLNHLRFKADEYCASLHAEMMAFLRLPYGLDHRNLSIYVYRENRFGELRMSRPCPSCMSKIKELGINNIYYTSTDGGYCHERLVYE
jgi:hypothetical protein|nr:MAG TPA: nucleoside deaminase [Caudoviricetes sp.]